MPFFRALVTGVVQAQRRIDPIIHAALPPTWPLTRIDLTLRAILRCGVFELAERRDIPGRVVISEYVDIARAFFSADEPGLVNGVLDRVAHERRPEEFSKRCLGLTPGVANDADGVRHSARAASPINLPLEGRSKFEASERSEDAREFREGGAEWRCPAPLPKPSALR